MLLQLTGRLDPDEKYAIIDLEGADLVAHSAPPSLDYVELELVNITICHNPAHNHFEPFPPTAAYPIGEDVWPEKITIKVPRPMPLVHRRRTRFFTFPGDPEPTVSYRSDNEEEEEVEIKRVKRSPQPRIVPLTDYQVEYRARFVSPLITLDIAGLGQGGANNTIAKIVKSLQNVSKSRIDKHYQRLLLSSPSFELETPPSGTRRGLNKVKITLPPLTRLTCSSKDFYTILGFGSQVVEVTTTIEAAENKWGLVNLSRTEAKVFVSSEFVETTTMIGVLFTFSRINFSGDSLAFYFERYPYSIPNTYLTFVEEALCLQNPGASTYFFQLLFDCIVQQMDLPVHSLRAGLKKPDRQHTFCFSKTPLSSQVEIHLVIYTFTCA